MDVGFEEIPACVPVPVNVIAAGEFGAVLTNVRFPLVAPGTVGENLAVKVVLSPAPSVNGNWIPEKLKPDPLADIWETVVLPDPLFVSVTVSELLLPIATFPKFTGEGLALRSPWAPVPDDVITYGLVGELFTREMVPETVEVEVGEKTA
jgi:hypothetical protein